MKFHKLAMKENIAVTDDCALAEFYGRKIKITEGSYENIKLTTPEDILTAERILTERNVLK
jgi:2-C-methyl-D-erythritol 4-phosphate cytidylyltransferase